jgi:MFS family permease
LRIFVLLCVFLGGLGQGVVNPKLPEILADHARLALDSGISASLMYAGIFMASFLYGTWADRGHTFRLLATGLIFYAGVLVLICYAQTKEAIFFLRLLEGLSLSAIYVAADVVLCRASKDQERGQWLSYYGLALSLGLLCGPALVLGLEWAKLEPALRFSLLGVAGLSLLLAVISVSLRLPQWPQSSSEPVDNRGAGLAAVLYGFLEAGLVAVLAATVVQYFHTKVEIIFILVIVSAAVASIGWGILIDRIGGRRTLQLVFLAFTLGIGGTSLGQIFKSGEWVLIAGAISFGIAAGGIYPAGFAWLIEGCHPSQYGYASGMFTRAYGLGSLFGPLCFGLAVEWTGPIGLFSGAVLLGLFGMYFSRNSGKGKAAA